MQRIVMHTSEPSSGAARYVSGLVAGLTANQAPVTLFCPPTFDYVAEVKSRGAGIAFSAHRSTEQAGLAARVARNLRFLLGAARRQLQATRRGDIVHVQFPLYFPAGLAFFLLARLRRCVIVFTAHDPLPHKWLLPRSLRPLEWHMLRWAYCLSDRLIVHNEQGRKVLIEQFRQNPDKIAIVPHGMFTAPRRLEAPPDGALRLLLYGGIRENKGVHLAIQAVQRINSSASPQVYLTIAGAVPNAREQTYWDECRRLIAQNPSGITAIDRYIDNSEEGPLIAAHHAFLLPYCGFNSESGVATLALSYSRPIVATRAGGIGAVLAQCDCGVPIEDATVEGVAAAILRARDAGTNRLRQMGEAGALYMETGRSWNEIGRRTLAVYAETLAVAGVRN